MPIYEYRCADCGHQDEFLQKVSEPVLTQCPVCGKPSLQKLLSAAGFHLKGSGWYATDFKNKGSKPAEKKAEPAAGKAEARAEAKAEAKAEARTEAKTEAKTEVKTGTKADSAPATTD
jgi:putative FmdB family regulatory protein